MKKAIFFQKCQFLAQVEVFDSRLVKGTSLKIGIGNDMTAAGPRFLVVQSDMEYRNRKATTFKDILKCPVLIGTSLILIFMCGWTSKHGG